MWRSPHRAPIRPDNVVFPDPETPATSTLSGVNGSGSSAQSIRESYPPVPGSEE